MSVVAAFNVKASFLVEGIDRTMLIDTGFGTLLRDMVLELADAFDTIWPSHGDYPLTVDVIPGILQGTQDLLNGKLSGEEPPWPMPCKKYTCDVASFLY